MLTLFIIIFNIIQSKFLEDSSSDEKIITTITSDDEASLKEALFYLWKLGGIIYIDTPVINFKNQGSLSITGTRKGGIIGIKQANGQYPRLNFKESRDNSTIYQSGIDIVGTNKYLENIIIENAGSYGIFINGQKNTIDHVITRYNGQSGIYLSPESESNVFNYCYSYRNFHFAENELIADGFTVDGANNIFNNCFAWENSHNGFGNYYKGGKHKNGELTFIHSGSWNNGNIDVFSGKYDFDNEKPLDKNLWTIQEIIKSDKTFEKNYNDKIFNLDNSKIDSISANLYFSDYNKNEGGNGFYFENDNSEQTLINMRTINYCVAFDHKSKGFNSNKSLNSTFIISNCVGFENKMNYDLPFSLFKWSNNWSWESKEENILYLNLTTKKPVDINSAKKSFYFVRDQIINAVYTNNFPENINFDKIIKSLNE